MILHKLDSAVDNVSRQLYSRSFFGYWMAGRGGDLWAVLLWVSIFLRIVVVIVILLPLTEQVRIYGSKNDLLV